MRRTWFAMRGSRFPSQDRPWSTKPVVSERPRYWVEILSQQINDMLLWKNMIKDRQITCRNLGMHESLVDDCLKSPDGYEH